MNVKKIRLLKLLLFNIILLLGSHYSFGQQVSVSGTVVDTNNEPLIGVTVTIVNTNQGVVTDFNGSYTIAADPKSVLQFSFVGFESKTMAVANQKVINVTLAESIQQLDELVVIGYGVVKKRDLTGATSSIKGTDIVQVPVTTAAQALTGKVAGVNVVTQSGAPGADINITVRGGTSITQSSKPLYIVDGFQMDEGLKNIDVNDIESIDVMKDASATAIYGARGSNGVIIITTKSGKSGKTEVRYNGYMSFERLGKKLSLLNTEEYVRYQYDYQTLAGGVEKWADMFGGDMNSSDFYTGAYGRIAQDYGSRAGIDWQDEVFGGTAVMQNHNVSISGGNDKSKFLISYNNTNQDGLLAKSGYNKNSIMAKLNHEINSRIRTDFSTNLQSSVVEGGGSLGGMLKMSILQPVTGGVRFTNDQLLGTDISDEMLDVDSQYDIYNPIIMNDAVTDKKYTRKASINGGLEIDILKDLTFRTAATYSWQQVRSDYWDDGRTKTAQNNKGPWGKRNNSEKYSWQITNTLSWKKSLDKHSVNVMLGQETMYSETMKLDNTYYEFPENNFGLNNVSMAKKVYSYGSGKSRYGIASVFGRVMYNFDNRYLVTGTLRGDGVSKFARGKQWGALPSASVAWRISEEAFMKDLDVVDNLKLRIGYGITGNCDVDDNMYVTDYGSTEYSIGGVDVTGLKPGSILGNPALKWEKTTSTSLGLDVSVLKGRINLTADFYNNESDNLLMKVQIPASTGYTQQFQNIATIRNRGLEFVVNTMNIRRKDFQWTTDFNISFNRSKVLDLYGDGGADYYRPNVSSRVDFEVRKGQPLGQFYGYKYQGVYTTDDFIQNADGTYKLKDGVPYLKGKKITTLKPGDVKYLTTAGNVDANGTPVWSTDDRSVIGSAEPKFTGGMSNTFTYKGFDLSLFFSFSYGNEIFNMSSQRFIGPYLPNQNSLSDMNSRFTLIDPSTGKETTDLARLAELNPNQYSKKAMWSLHSDNKIAITDALDYYLEDGSFLRLNTITLGYTLPKQLSKKAFISNARIYGTLNNIYTFTNYTGYDPEVSATGSTITRGVDDSSYPKAKSFVVGLNLTF
ncbi:MAG: SusC/RagA family TonB-linked outer membrane protein [Breznakibacter sp.]